MTCIIGQTENGVKTTQSSLKVLPEVILHTLRIPNNCILINLCTFLHF